MSQDFNADEQAALEQLAQDFLKALQLKDAGKVDKAEDLLLSILSKEPRLAEPRMELARMHLDTGRLSDAESHAREALTQLEQGGQWTDDLPENVVLGLAHGLLAEVLRNRADSDEVLFGNPDVFKALVKEAKKHFAEAARLDPSDEYASYHAFFLGPPKGTKVEMLGDEDAGSTAETPEDSEED